MTKREQQLLIAIGDFWARNFRAPSYREMGEEVVPKMSPHHTHRAVNKTLIPAGYASAVGGKHCTVALTQQGEDIYKKIKKSLA